MRFSQKYGLKPIKDTIQLNSMDEDLRNGLWNALCECYWARVEGVGWIPEHKPLEILLKSLWSGYHNKAYDTLDHWWDNTYKEIREYFFACEW